MNIALPLLANEHSAKTEKKLFKLISTFSSLDLIQKLSSEHQLITGLKQRRASLKLDLNTDTYKNLVYPKLGITSDTGQDSIEKKESIALQYAQILKKYKPDDSGKLHELFNYFELVSVIKQVFKQHLRGGGKIFYTGIPILIETNLFYAKVNAGQIYIISGTGKQIGQGTTGTVCSVYEIATSQFLALKIAHKNNAESLNDIQTEITNLKKIQKQMSLRVTKFEGIQSSILADFNLPKNDLVGYLGPQYKIDLIDWIDNNSATPQERIVLCKRLMRVFKNIDELGFWHGDIKPDNIMLNDNQPIVIDWTGALAFKEAATKLIKPKLTTSQYLNKIDILALNFMIAQKKLLTITSKDEVEKFRNDYIKTAKSLELFSISLTLFMTLTSESPFDDGSIIPQSERGMNKSPLIKMNYSDDIIQILTKMLAHQPSDRYLINEAFNAWENIDETTGRTRVKTYKLT